MLTFIGDDKISHTYQRRTNIIIGSVTFRALQGANRLKFVCTGIMIIWSIIDHAAVHPASCGTCHFGGVDGEDVLRDQTLAVEFVHVFQQCSVAVSYRIETNLVVVLRMGIQIRLRRSSVSDAKRSHQRIP